MTFVDNLANAEPLRNSGQGSGLRSLKNKVTRIARVSKSKCSLILKEPKDSLIPRGPNFSEQNWSIDVYLKSCTGVLMQIKVPHATKNILHLMIAFADSL